MDLTSLLTGAGFGALITGAVKIGPDILARRNARAVLIHGFAAEIGAGLKSIPEKPSDEDALFLAFDGLPYDFYKANKNKVGLVVASKAEPIVSYYSLRWQLYKAAQALHNALPKPGGPDEKDEVGLATERLHRLLAATKSSAAIARAALHKS